MSDINTAIRELKEYYPIFKTVGQLEWRKKKFYAFNGKIIEGEDIPRMLFYIINYLNSNNVLVTDNFKRFGLMIDFSRGAVFNVDYFKQVIRTVAIMGYNTILCYTEDTYEIKDLPYFGYMRGKFLQSEMQEIVAYADIFGIKVIPCIQTLDHLGQYLRWEEAKPVKNTPTTVIPGNEATYELIDKMIAANRAMYTSDTIHIGLDEAFGFYGGNYLKTHKEENPYHVFLRHLKRVNEICLKHGFTKVQMWSDMFFRMGNVDNYYYDPESVIPEDIKNAIPDNVELVYWDYYNRDYNIYDKMIQAHREFKNNTVVATGCWTWGYPVYNQEKTEASSPLCIKACIKNDIDTLYVNQWMDDGAMCAYDSSYHGLLNIAYSALTNGTLNSKVFQQLTNSTLKSKLKLLKLNDMQLMPLGILWDDVIKGIYLNNETLKNPNCLDESISHLRSYIKSFNTRSYTLSTKYLLSLAQVIEIKLQIRKELLKSYFVTKNFDKVIILCKKSRRLFSGLQRNLRNMWYEYYKSAGLDVLQARIAGEATRVNELVMMIEDLKSGRTNCIEELENMPKEPTNIKFSYETLYKSMIHVVGE